MAANMAPGVYICISKSVQQSLSMIDKQSIMGLRQQRLHGPGDTPPSKTHVGGSR